MKFLSRLKIEKYGEYWKAPYFTAFSLIPFCQLHEEVWIFWLPYAFTFIVCLGVKKLFDDSIVLKSTLIGLPIALLHHQMVAEIDLLFFGRLLLFIQLGLLLMPVNKRIIALIYFINFVLVLVGAALIFEFWFAIYLILFLFSMGYLCLELQLTGFTKKPSFKFHARYATKLILFLLICGYILFLIIPRFSFGKLPSQLGISISGFSDTVSFDDVTNILQSDKVAMRVKTSHSPSYYRGVTLDYYNGSEWINSSYFRPVSNKFNSDGTISLPIEYSRTPIKEVKSFQFQLLPSKNKYLFIPQYGQSIKIHPPRIETNQHGDLRRSQTLTENLEYTVLSGNPKSIRQNDSPIIDNSIKNQYLQIPEVSTQLKKLALLITANSSGYWSKVQAILNSFENRGYEYSLKSIHRGDPLESFLLKNKVGHCQYFAGAMVLLLRLNGIPSRVINGFLPGEYNEWGDYYTVRYRDAHSWVEVYAGNGIWVLKDPTPANRNLFEINFLKGFYSQWIKIKELIDSQWQDYVLYFSDLDQLMIWYQLETWIGQNPNLTLIILTILIGGIIQLMRLFFASFEGPTPTNNKFVYQFEDLISKFNLERTPDIGLEEMILKADLDINLRKDLLHMAQIINQLCFAKKAKYDDLVSELNRLNESIRKKPKN